MILVLIGYRGTGKSTVGEVLSKRLGMRYICMDHEIEKKAGMTTPEIVAQYGWQKFRDIESEVTRELTWFDNFILDTGGGVIERPENIKDLQTNAAVFWLKATIETVIARIQTGTQRPALTSGKTFIEEVAEVLERRTPIYQSAAHYEIDTDDSTPEQVAERIIEIWTLKKDTNLAPSFHVEESEMFLLQKKAGNR
jgi:shikimate kinase